MQLSWGYKIHRVGKVRGSGSKDLGVELVCCEREEREDGMVEHSPQAGWIYFFLEEWCIN